MALIGSSMAWPWIPLTNCISKKVSGCTLKLHVCLYIYTYSCDQSFLFRCVFGVPHLRPLPAGRPPAGPVWAPWAPMGPLGSHRPHALPWAPCAPWALWVPWAPWAPSPGTIICARGHRNNLMGTSGQYRQLE